jgi:acetyltransferase-like isoleucine patch superfamily enzyme
MRFRTAKGHQIMMNDTQNFFYIAHANGQTWIELGAEGTVDIFSTNSVNVRTQGDINLHADRDINMFAGRNINMKSKENTNIGAGVITANYDGRVKHKTFIGKDVFVGSGVTIIAPVTIGDRVIVAAGSTVTEDIASNGLAIARSKQMNKPNYYDVWLKKIGK